MSIKTLLAVLTVALCSYTDIYAQTGIVTGTITDAVSGKPVELVNVQLDGTTLGAVTDTAGNFTITEVKPGVYNVKFSSIGYKAKALAEVEVTNAKPAILSVELESESKDLNEVVVQANPFTRRDESPVSVRTIGTNEIQRSPGGNRDISRVVQALPGIGFSTSFRNDLIVRGGSPVENRFYLDDIEIPNINHFATQGGSGGPVGLINVDFIREVNFYSSAFPADRGNALSSVMDIRLRDGRSDRWGGNIALGITDAALSMETPLGKGKKATLLASVRASYYNWFFKLIQVPIFPNYNDAQAKIRWKIDEKNELEFLSLTACDIFKLNLDANKTEEQRYTLQVLPENNQWSYTNGIKFTHYFNNSYIRAVVSSSQLVNHVDKYKNNNRDSLRTTYYRSIESEAKTRVEYIGRKNGWKYYVGVGYELGYYYNRSKFTGAYFKYDFLTKLFVHKYAAFASVSKQVANNRLLLTLGMRFDGNSYNKNMANILNQASPRFSFSYSIRDDLKLNFNTGYYHQMPTYTAMGYRDTASVLVNRDRLTYLHCVHVVTGLEYYSKINSRVAIEGFFKQYFSTPFLLDDSVAQANLGGDFGVVGNAPAISNIKGRSYGVEVSYEQKLFKGWYGIFAYTLFWSQFQDKNNNYVSASWDTRHIISFTAGKKLKRNWEIGLRYRVQGGRPYTPYNVAYSSLISVYNSNPQGVLDYNQLNTLRLPWFHQLDLRVTKKWYLPRWTLEVYLDIQNAYYNKTRDVPSLVPVTDQNGVPLYTSDMQSYQLKLLENRNGILQPQLGIIIGY
jgi:hypothetical protein